MITYYAELGVEKKKKLRAYLEMLSLKRKEELRYIQEGLIKPITDGITLRDRVVKGEISLELMKIIIKGSSKQIVSFLK